jgi:hypothetical protein
MATPSSTIEALLFVLRHGLTRLDDPGNRSRLAACDDVAMTEISRRLLNAKTLSNNARPNWPRDDVTTLITKWRTVARRK